MEEMIKILEDIRPDVDFINEKALIDDQILDSFDLIAIVDKLDKAYDIQIDIDDLEPVNFNSAEAMWALVLKLRNAE